MYCSANFKTKKAIKEAISEGKKVTVFSPGPFPANQNGIEYIEGPHYPEPYKWYATVVVENGIIVKVK